MDRYSLENAVNHINDYYYPRPCEHDDAGKRKAFERARVEATRWKNEYIANMSIVTYEQFIAAKKRRLDQEENATRWAVAMASDVLKLPPDKRSEFIDLLFGQVRKHVEKFTRKGTE